MYKGIIDLNLDVFDGNYPVEGLRYKGFAAESLEFDMSKMLDPESKNNWAEMEEIQFFDVDHRGEKDLPAVTFKMEELTASSMETNVWYCQWTKSAKRADLMRSGFPAGL